MNCPPRNRSRTSPASSSSSSSTFYNYHLPLSNRLLEVSNSENLDSQCEIAAAAELHRSIFSQNIAATMKRNSFVTKGSQVSARKKPREQRRWTAAEEDAILQSLRNTIASGRLIEKPTAEAYYETMLQQVRIVNCTSNQLKSKVKNMKKSYMDTLVWRNQAGLVLLENDGKEEFTKITLQRCPTFEIQSEIYGTELNVYPHRTLSRRVPTEDLLMQDVVVDCDVRDVVMEDIKGLPLEALDSSSCSSYFEAESTTPDLIKDAQSKGHIGLLTEARNRKTTFDNRRLDLDYLKFEFEKKKWEQELDLRQQEINLKQLEISLEDKRIEKNYLLSRYELELKYGSAAAVDKMNSAD